jgi:hypothetical protein
MKKPKTIIPLAESFRQFDKDYLQLYRSGKAAIYQVTTGKKQLVTFEAIVIHPQQSTLASVKKIREIYPKPSLAGVALWIYPTLTEANEKYERLVKYYSVKDPVKDWSSEEKFKLLFFP